MATWRKALDEIRGDEELIACTMTEEQLDTEFDPGWGGTEGCAFQAWTKTRVFFPLCYDGSEWVGEADRNPCDRAREHDGG